MIVLDTNVVSELMRSSPQPQVLSWLDDQLASTLFVTAITEAELRYGSPAHAAIDRVASLATSVKLCIKVPPTMPLPRSWDVGEPSGV